MPKWICTGVLLVLSLVLVGSALAQEAFTAADGLVSFTVPDGWQVEEDGTRVIVANNLEGLDIGRRGASALPGTIVLLVAATANIPEVNSDADIAPADLIDTFLNMTGMEGEIIASSINGYPVVQAQVTTIDTELAGTEAGIIGVGTPNGTVFIILETGDELADYGAELMQIVESMTSSSVEAAAEVSSAVTGSMLTYNSSVTGTLSSSAPEQLFTFTGTQGDIVTITLIANDTSLLDPWVWLLTSAGFAGDELVPLADNDDTADSSIGGLNSQIVDFELPETGEYTIRATSFRGAGDFTLILESDSAPLPVTSAAEPIRQWATAASATSQYGSDNWSATQAVGAPDTNECGDITTAWASASSTGSDSLTVEYAQAVIPAQVSIYQTYNPGSIIEVQVITASGSVIVVPNSADPPGNTDCPGVFVVDIADVTEPVTGVTIVLDQTIGGSWNEIDAVELVGFDPAAAPPSTSTSAAGAVDAAALLGDNPNTAALESGITIPYPADFVELSVTDTFFSVRDADITTMFTHYARPPFTIHGTGAEAVDFIVSMFYNSFPFTADDVIDVLGDGSILLGFAETNSGAQVAFYVYELDGDLYFLQVEAFTDGSDTPFFPIAPDMLALGQAMVQSILAN